MFGINKAYVKLCMLIFYIKNMADTELLPRLFYININLHFPGSSPEVTRDNASQKTATLKDVGNYATKALKKSSNHALNPK